MAIKHIITFIGNGIYTDSKKDMWYKGDHDNPNVRSQREYIDNNYKNREDLHFMVEYGAMKHTIVEFDEPKAVVEPPKVEAEAPKVESPKVTKVEAPKVTANQTK